MIQKKFFKFDIMLGDRFYLTMRCPMSLTHAVFVNGKIERVVDEDELKTWVEQQKPSLEHKDYTIAF